MVSHYETSIAFDYEVHGVDAHAGIVFLFRLFFQITIINRYNYQYELLRNDLYSLC